jgi:hypothetical protein
MPVLTLEKPTSLASGSPAVRNVLGAIRQPLRMPAWAMAVAVLLIGISAFVAGRHKPVHHYISYFGYPMVLDTTTGKACYAAPRKPTDPIEQDSAFAIDGASDTQPSGPAIPMCGKE